MPHRLVLLVLLMAVLTAGGCRSTYYAAWEKAGWHKRDILVDRVKNARDAQEQAKEQFASALESFIAVTNFDGGDLQRRYDDLHRQYERSRERAEAVRGRIASVDQVAVDLFNEWERELAEYQSDDLRRSSERQLHQTQERYEGLIRSMRDAEAKMDPVLAAFADQVLFLKHNLNARAIASLQDTAASIQNDVAVLIREMEQSINEANAFIEQMGTS